VLARWGFLAAAAACFGLALFPIYAATGGEERRALAGAAGLALAAALAWLGLAIVSFGGRDPRAFASMAGTVLFGTTLGPPWLVRFGAALGLLAALRLEAPRVLVLALAAILLLTEAWIGHGAAHGAAYRAMQAAHLLAAGAWIGGLLALVRRSASGNATVLRRFSRIGATCVAVIAASGGASAWVILGHLPGASAAYDRLVLAKTGLFAAMTALAACNRFVLLPALGRGGPRASRWLSRSVLAEVLLGMGALLLAALLGVTNPAP
jgi:putative copper resistance protein D